MTCKTEIRVSKRCPNCDWRVLDKVTPTTGVIEMKCPRCGKMIEIDLSLRRSALSYRLYRRTVVR